MCKEPKFAAVLLAGGRSRRMGKDKATLEFEGLSLLDRGIAFWKSIPQVSQVIVAVGRSEHLAGLLPEDVIPVVDRYPGLGPLAGIQMAFEACDADYLYVSAVDMPFICSPIVPAADPDYDVICYNRHGLSEPLFGLYSRAVLPIINTMLSAGISRMKLLLGEVRTKYIDMAPEMLPFLSNINTPAAYAMIAQPPVITFSGRSGSGKTTFLEKLIPLLKAEGLKIAILKHDAHHFDIDKPGKDTYRFKAAGADVITINDNSKCAIIFDVEKPPTVDELISHLPPVDLVITEGFKTEHHAKIEVNRSEVPTALLASKEEMIALVTDGDFDVDVPVLSFDDLEKCRDIVLDFVANYKGKLHKH